MYNLCFITTLCWLHDWIEIENLLWKLLYYTKCNLCTMLVSLHNPTAVVLLHIVILWQGDIISIILTSCKTTLLLLLMVLMVCGLFNFVWSTDWVRINLVDLFLDWILKGLLYDSPIENKDNIYYWSVPNELVLYSYYMFCENKRSVKMKVHRKRIFRLHVKS